LGLPKAYKPAATLEPEGRSYRQFHPSKGGNSTFHVGGLKPVSLKAS